MRGSREAQKEQLPRMLASVSKYMLGDGHFVLVWGLYVRVNVALAESLQAACAWPDKWRPRA